MAGPGACRVAELYLWASTQDALVISTIVQTLTPKTIRTKGASRARSRFCAEDSLCKATKKRQSNGLVTSAKACVSLWRNAASCGATRFPNRRREWLLSGQCKVEPSDRLWAHSCHDTADGCRAPVRRQGDYQTEVAATSGRRSRPASGQVSPRPAPSSKHCISNPLGIDAALRKEWSDHCKAFRRNLGRC
jgi:hypothetical protein